MFISKQGLAFILFLVFSFVSNGQLSMAEADARLERLHKKEVRNRDTAMAESHVLLQFFREKNQPCKVVRALSERAIQYVYIYDYEKALLDILTAKNILQKTNCGDEVSCWLSFALANVYCESGQGKKRDSLVFKVLKDCRSIVKDEYLLANFYVIAAQYTNELEKAVPLFDSTLKMARAVQNLELEQEGLRDLGVAYAIEKKFDIAYTYMEKAMKVAKRRNDIHSLGDLYNNMAGLSSDGEKVLMYMDSAVYYSRKTKDIHDIQTMYENMGLAYYRQNRFKEGYDILYKALLLKDSVHRQKRVKTIMELEEKYEAEKKSNEIQTLRLEKLNAEVEKLTYKRNQNTLLAGSFILIIVLGVLTFNFVTIKKNRNLLADKNQELSLERKRSDELLLNILPEEIAEELKVTGKAKAKQFDVASILFTDFIEFTETSEAMGTEELVQELNYCFMGFDNILGKYNLEKIKTIGDSYMAAGGIPVPSDLAAANTVMAALEMQIFMLNRNEELNAVGKRSFTMRAGINTGTVVAGIVGVKKFQYDIWGDTVNTASRMESMGEAGKVNISQSTYELIKNDNRFIFENRGNVEVKGKGELPMYFAAMA
jgi:class 3 adenylate cyclase